MQIIVKRKLYFLEGTVEAPTYPKSQEYDVWHTNNGLIISWICGSVTKGIANSIIYSNIANSIMCSDSTHTIWEDLKEKFQMGNETYIYHIQQDLAHCYQGSDSVNNYHTKLKAL